MVIPEPSKSTVNRNSRLSALAYFLQHNFQNAREVKMCSGEFANFQLSLELFLLIKELQGLQLHLLPSFF